MDSESGAAWDASNSSSLLCTRGVPAGLLAAKKAICRVIGQRLLIARAMRNSGRYDTEKNRERCFEKAHLFLGRVSSRVRRALAPILLSLRYLHWRSSSLRSGITSDVFDTACTIDCTTASCSCTQEAEYWSSSTNQSSPAEAWVVDFSDGSSFHEAKLDSHAARAVRGGF